MCSRLIGLNQEVVFAGIVDDYGRLLAGNERNSGCTKELEMKTREVRRIFPFFLLNYVLEAIGEIISSSNSDSDYNNAHTSIQIRIFEFDKAALMVIPVTDQGNRFLCIYLDGNCLNDGLILKLIQNGRRC